MSLEWKRFEEVCAKFMILRGHNARLTQIGADGGIDIKIYSNNQLAAIVQCKAWTWNIGVKAVRELYGIMASEQVNSGIFITTSKFTEEAINFCNNKKIILINGDDLIRRIKSLPIEQQKELFDFATQGDYTTPTCPLCDEKMIARVNQKSASFFWGCVNYPKCRYRLQVRKA